MARQFTHDVGLTSVQGDAKASPLADPATAEHAIVLERNTRYSALVMSHASWHT